MHKLKNEKAYSLVSHDNNGIPIFPKEKQITVPNYIVTSKLAYSFGGVTM